MNTKISWIIAIVVIVGGIFLLSSNGNDSSSDVAEVESTSALVVDESSYDFGDIDIFGGKVRTDFMLTNSGTGDIEILAGTTSCGCTDGNIGGISFGMHEGMAKTVTIQAGESKALTAIYDPLAHGPNATGPVTRQLFLKTNSTETPEIEVKVSANVVKQES